MIDLVQPNVIRERSDIGMTHEHLAQIVDTVVDMHRQRRRVVLDAIDAFAQKVQTVQLVEYFDGHERLTWSVRVIDVRIRKSCVLFRSESKDSHYVSLIVRER